MQAAISASHAAYTTGGQDSRLYIPTPDASQTIDLKEFHRLYKTPFNNPSSFVRFSATVEDSIGCPYMMDEADDEWLTTFNKSHPKLLLSEDAFESIMWRIESISLEKVPYLETVSPMLDQVVEPPLHSFMLTRCFFIIIFFVLLIIFLGYNKYSTL